MKISYAVFCLKKKNEIAALAASERRDADLDRLFAALSTMRFFFNDTATTEIYTLSLHDALPILPTHTREGTVTQNAWHLVGG